MASIEDISLGELILLRELANTKSIRELARRKNLTPAKVSRMFRHLEQTLGVKMIERSAVGVVLSREAKTIIPKLDFFLPDFEHWQTSLHHQDQSGSGPQEIHIGATSFMSAFILAPALATLSDQIRFRLLDLSPDLLVAAGLRGTCDVSVHAGPLSWTQSWATEKVGYLRWILVARKNHPLGVIANLAQVLKYPFVVPIYASHDGIHTGNDKFPVSIHKRLRGHEVATAEAAVAVVAHCDQLTFIPEVVARPHLSTTLQEISIRKAVEVKEGVHLSVRTDVIRESTRRAISQTLKVFFD